MKGTRIWVSIALIIVLGITVFNHYHDRQPDQAVDLPPQEEQPQAPAEEEEIPEETPDEEPSQEGKTGVQPGNRAPKLQLENSEGELVGLEEVEGIPVVMSFWVNWNEEAVKQLGILENLQPLFDKDVKLVGVHASAFDSISIAEVLEIIEEADYSYEMLIDKDAEAQQSYYVGSFPTTFLIDPEGSIYKVYTTTVEEDQLLEDLEEVLKSRDS